ncbi:MAG: pyridoxal-phosphate dependent enzyme, partial [Candidatus Hydrogenedentes bacterium]|nr:pyridoxal-phosphate dependent enzyme [Candidatus Hydrogenedentota bacterium]
KRDDLSATEYGGNKVRKLEFLLGEARHEGRREVLTFGFAGSNHALATAFFANKLGMRGISVLLPQPNARSVRRNLLFGHHSGAEFHHYETQAAATVGTLAQLARHRIRHGAWPKIVPAGGSSPLGILGIVNGVLELDEQVRAGLMPAPRRIYTAVGSMGTTVGILIGLALTGIEATVVPVRVIDASMASAPALETLFARTVAFMRALDPSVPALDFQPARSQWRDDYFGERYALFTERGVEAIRMLEQTEGIRIDGTYAGKALAAVIGDARAGALDGQSVLFWNTYNSRPFWESMPPIDYHVLPRTLHRYFEEPTQPLDT